MCRQRQASDCFTADIDGIQNGFSEVRIILNIHFSPNQLKKVSKNAPLCDINTEPNLNHDTSYSFQIYDWLKMLLEDYTCAIFLFRANEIPIIILMLRFRNNHFPFRILNIVFAHWGLTGTAVILQTFSNINHHIASLNATEVIPALIFFFGKIANKAT